MIRKHFNSRWPSIVTWTVGYFTLQQVRPANIGTNQYELMMPALDSMFQWLIFFSYFWINHSHKFIKQPKQKNNKKLYPAATKFSRNQRQEERPCLWLGDHGRFHAEEKPMKHDILIESHMLIGSPAFTEWALGDGQAIHRSFAEIST